MSTMPTPATFAAELPEITRADIARFVKEGRRRRAEADGQALPLRRSRHRPPGPRPGDAGGDTPERPRRHEERLTATAASSTSIPTLTGGRLCRWPVERTFPC